MIKAGCLKNVSVSALQSTSNTLPLLNSSALPLKALVTRGAAAVHFSPYVDGEVIPVQPSKRGVQVPSIFGSSKSISSIRIVSPANCRIPSVSFHGWSSLRSPSICRQSQFSAGYYVRRLSCIHHPELRQLLERCGGSVPSIPIQFYTIPRLLRHIHGVHDIQCHLPDTARIERRGGKWHTSICLRLCALA